jgi:hypothetical protein
VLEVARDEERSLVRESREIGLCRSDGGAHFVGIRK